MPCLCDTICFLLQLFSSVVKHSSEMRPSTFIPSQNPSLAPWVVCLPLSWIQEAAAASLWSCFSSPSLFLPSSQSFLGRQCPSSKPLPVKPVSAHQTKSQRWLTCAKQDCYLSNSKMRTSCWATSEPAQMHSDGIRTSSLSGYLFDPNPDR